MAGFKDIAKRKRKRLEELEKSMRQARGARTGGMRRMAEPAKKPTRRRVVQPRVTAAQAVPSITGDSTAREARLAEIQRRLREIQASSTTPDRR